MAVWHVNSSTQEGDLGVQTAGKCAGIYCVVWYDRSVDNIKCLTKWNRNLFHPNLGLRHSHLWPLVSFSVRRCSMKVSGKVMCLRLLGAYLLAWFDWSLLSISSLQALHGGLAPLWIDSSCWLKHCNVAENTMSLAATTPSSRNAAINPHKGQLRGPSSPFQYSVSQQLWCESPYCMVLLYVLGMSKGVLSSGMPS